MGWLQWSLSDDPNFQARKEPSEDAPLRSFRIHAECFMKQYAQYHGELAPGSKDQYRSKKLDLACEAFGIVPGGHRALADAEASRQVLLKMADVEI